MKQRAHPVFGGRVFLLVCRLLLPILKKSEMSAKAFSTMTDIDLDPNRKSHFV